MNDKKRISGNPSSKELLDGIQGMDALSQLYRIVPEAKKNFPRLEKAFSNLEDVKKQSEILFLPDRFNDKFSPFGWIAYESMNVEVMKNAIKIEEEKGLEEAEDYLADYYDVKSLKWLILRLNGHSEFRRRLRLIELAKEDYLAGRYHACIPLLLSLTDGIVNDVSNHVGLFANGADMTAWDSIAAHESGLQTLAKLIGKGRRKTNEERITIPYRNGILHGRELSFDNKIVAAKCWSILFSIRDWAQALAEGKKSPKETKDKSLLDALRDYTETKSLSDRLKSWGKRDWLDGCDWASYSSSEELEIDSPEYAMVVLLKHWEKNQWGMVAEYITDFLETPINKKAGQIRKDFSHIKILSYKILSVTDETPAFSNVTVKVVYEFECKSNEATLELRPTYLDSESMPMLRGEEGGCWQINRVFPVSLP